MAVQDQHPNVEAATSPLPMQSEQRFRALLEHSADAIALLDNTGLFLYITPSVQSFLGFTPEELVGRNGFELVSADQIAFLKENFEKVAANPGYSIRVEHKYLHKDGSVRWLESTVTNALDKPAIGAIVSNFHDITGRRQAEMALAGEKQALELMAQGAPLTQIMEVLTRLAEEQSIEKVLASVLLLNEDGIHLQHAAGPSLPLSYIQAIDGIAIGPNVGSCGTAAYRNEAVYVSDIATDPLWADFRDVALAHGLHACWSTPIRASNGQVSGTFAIYYQAPRLPNAQDQQLIDLITHTASVAIERKRAEDVSRRNEEQLRAIFEHATIGIAFTDAKGHFLRVNPRYCAITGYSQEELLQLSFLHILHPDDIQESPRLMKEMIEGTIPAVVVERRYLHKDGGIVQVRNSISPVRDEQGNILNFVALTEDITEEKKAGEERYRLAAIVSSSDDVIISKTLDGIITSWNDAAERMFGHTAKEAIGKHITLIIPPELYDEEVEIISKIRRGIRIQHYETTRIRKDGSRVEVSLSISPVKDSTGKIIGAAKIARDVTERRAFERRKDEFISMASHELKTPVTAIKGFTQLLQRRFQQRSDEASLHFLGRMDGQLNKLTKLISDLLDISKMQTGELQYRKEPFDLVALAQEIMENIQGTTQTHHLQLESPTHVQVFGDRDRIGQVVINLLTNAIKYSAQADKVLIRIAIDGENALLSVQDFGVGIEEAYQEKVFERFYQVSEPDGNTYPGLGIGLYIASEIIKRHEGHIWVESQQGKGSTFTFSLPLLKEESQQA